MRKVSICFDRPRHSKPGHRRNSSLAISPPLHPRGAPARVQRGTGTTSTDHVVFQDFSMVNSPGICFNIFSMLVV